jgi:hypothetical protein
MSAPVTVWCYKLEEEFLPNNGIRHVRLFAEMRDVNMPSAERRMCESGPKTREEWRQLRAKFARVA